MKTKEEMNELMQEVQDLSRRLAELDEEELKQISGGLFEPSWNPITPLVTPTYGLCGLPVLRGSKCPKSGHPLNQIYTEEPSSFCDNCEFK